MRACTNFLSVRKFRVSEPLTDIYRGAFWSACHCWTVTWDLKIWCNASTARPSICKQPMVKQLSSIFERISSASHVCDFRFSTIDVHSCLTLLTTESSWSVIANRADTVLSYIKVRTTVQRDQWHRSLVSVREDHRNCRQHLKALALLISKLPMELR